MLNCVLMRRQQTSAGFHFVFHLHFPLLLFHFSISNNNLVFLRPMKNNAPYYFYKDWHSTHEFIHRS